MQDLKSLIHTAERKQAKLRMGISGFAGSGKTWTALRVATGLVSVDDGTKIMVIDSENGSADLYGNSFKFKTLPIPDYSPDTYIQAIHIAEDEGIEVIIIDSLSHAWSAEGGVLDIKNDAASTKSYDNYTAWAVATPKQNALISAILKSPCHIIATFRSKYEDARVVEDGKKIIKRVGTKPIQRWDVPHEFTLFFEQDDRHMVQATKDRTGIYDNQDPKVLTEADGKILYDWLITGKEVEPPPPLAEIILNEINECTKLDELTNLYVKRQNDINSLREEQKKAVMARFTAHKGEISKGGENESKG